MTKQRKINIALSVLFYVAFAVFTWAVMNINVQPIGPLDSCVGFADFNKKIFDATGVNEIMYELTQFIGYISILICAVFGLIGATQLFKGKSLKKVDADIICMGILYILAIIAYVVFLKVTINCRPVLEDGVLESSYPSSHTILAICVFASLIVEINRRITDKNKALIEVMGCYAMICFTVGGRLLSGMHWATDIIGGIILSLAFIFTFKAILPERKCTRDTWTEEAKKAILEKQNQETK